MKPATGEFGPRSERALRVVSLQRALDRATGSFTQARIAAAGDRGDWNGHRDRARAVRAEALAHLDRYLVELEQAVTARGGVVHWAENAESARDYIVSLARQRGVRLAVKSKSMATEEIGLNAALEAGGITPVETDLGEYIIQLADESPSHFLAPAIHWTRDQVADLFQQHLGIERSTEPATLTAAARTALRSRFLDASMGISGANFAIADTGAIVILENEGNARLATSLPRLHVAVVGIEKVIPRMADLDPLLQVLARSATGQRMSTYVSILTGARRPDEPDGPDEFHLVLLDNGRSRLLADAEARESLLCIRCSACLAACPVYRRAGGHAYGWVYQGPIGSVLTPGLLGIEQASDLPFASSLCGACRDACPVKIDIPRMLVHFRHRAAEAGTPPLGRFAARLAAWIMRSPTRFRLAGRLGYRVQSLAGDQAAWLAPGPIGQWARARSVPKLARRPLRDLVGRR
ncbi:MAG: LutB/LldF family L-lactate oxidation iron-sulfur protein [Gemmatimonadales bacterium]